MEANLSMASSLYITADCIGLESGGGKVTFHESQAFQSLRLPGPCLVYGRDGKGTGDDNGVLPLNADWCNDPWGADEWMAGCSAACRFPARLAHFYAGTFSKTIERLKQCGCKITYTAAAHDVAKSKAEHEKLGLPYNYPHLTDPKLWRRYLAGYLAADILICPSQHSAAVMRSFGATNRIEVIPHGVDLPEKTSSLPARFQVGYLGSYMPDKGIIYLLQAWKKLNYKNATLILGGRDSTHPFVLDLINRFGGGNIHCTGWVDKISSFFDMVSLYVQPSVTEGFGIEVLEAMAHGRPVVCSTGAGAADVVPPPWRFEAGNVDALAEKIEDSKRIGDLNSGWVQIMAENYTWDKVRQRYTKLWTDVLAATNN